MDTFMDKLAQKFNAQEMIKANSAADAAELSRIREQNAEYEALIQKIKESNEKNALKVEELTAAGIAKIEETQAAGIAKIEEMQAAGQNTEEISALLEELKKVQAEQFEQLTDHVHKENVKVYRNVQAVVVDEFAKQNELSGKALKSVSKKIGAAIGISVVALLVSAAGLIFQILLYLHII